SDRLQCSAIVAVASLSAPQCHQLGLHRANIEALRRAMARLRVSAAYLCTDGVAMDGLGGPCLTRWRGEWVGAWICAGAVAGSATSTPRTSGPAITDTPPRRIKARCVCTVRVRSIGTHTRTYGRRSDERGGP